VAERPPVAAAPVGSGVGVIISPEAVEAVGALVAAGASRRRRLGTMTAGDVAVVEVFRSAVAANEGMAAGGQGIPVFVARATQAGAFLSVRSTAAVLGTSERTVRRLAGSGVLPGAARAGRDWQIPAATVALALATAHKEL